MKKLTVNFSQESMSIQLKLSNNTDLTREHFSQIKMYVFAANLKTGLDSKPRKSTNH